MRVISRRRRFAFAVVSMVLSVSLTLAGLLAVDLYAHYRAERTAGLNRWGYRGPTVGSKRDGEVRLAFAGGSTMFGYGVSASDAIPAVVERELNRALGGRPPVSTVNLGYNSEGAYSFAFTLRDFAYLDYDVAVLYEGYNDLMADPTAPNTAVFRHDSAIFRLTGYYPILPLVLREKAMSLRAGGNLAAAYDAARGEKVVFSPSFSERTSAAAVETVARITDALGRQFDALSAKPSRVIVPTESGCPYPWGQYCESVYIAVKEAVARGAHVVVVTQPRLMPPAAERHAEQQNALRDMLRRLFASNDRVTYVDLTNAVDVSNGDLSYDGMHLTVKGNQQLGAELARAVTPVVRRVRADA